MEDDIEQKSGTNDPLRSHDVRLSYISYEPGHHELQPRQPPPQHLQQPQQPQPVMPRVSEWNDYPPIRDEWAFQDPPRLDHSRSPLDSDLTTTHPLRVTPLTIYPPPPHRYLSSPHLPSRQLSNDDEQSVQLKKFIAEDAQFRMPSPSMRDCIIAVAVFFFLAFFLTIFVAVYFGNNSEPQ